MQETQIDSGPGGHSAAPPPANLQEAFRLTFRAGRWILQTRFALWVILAGLLFDHLIRLVITLNSQYLREIALPEAAFGVIAAGLSLLGVLLPRWARRMADHCSPPANFAALVVVTTLGLVGTALFVPYWGLVPLVLLYGVMVFKQFFTSHYLNQMTSSDQRATVLSFKGLSYNLAYGLVGIIYALALVFLRRTGEELPDMAQTYVFRLSFEALPWYFLFVVALFVVYAYRRRPAHEPPEAA